MIGGEGLLTWVDCMQCVEVGEGRRAEATRVRPTPKSEQQALTITTPETISTRVGLVNHPAGAVAGSRSGRRTPSQRP